MRRWWVLLGGVIVVAVGLVAALAIRDGDSKPVAETTPSTSPPEDRGDVIARVDGIPIYSLDAQARLESVQDVHATVEAELPAELKQTIFESLVNDVIVKREAKRRNLELGAGELELEVGKIVDMSGAAANFEKWLEDQGITRAELERRVNLTVTWERVKAAIVADVEMTDDEIRAYYDEHPEEFLVDGEPQSYIEVKAALETRLVGERARTVFADWLKEQRELVKVEILADEWKEAV